MTDKTINNTIVRAAIHPAIGIARVGNSKEGYFIGPEVPDQPALPLGNYKDKDEHGALKRQVARFRIFGYNAAGEVVKELNASNAEIKWSVELANKKAAWYQFHLALDIPVALEPTTPPSARRNATYKGKRSELEIKPDPQSISGCNKPGMGKDKGNRQYHFDGGTC